MRILFVCLGNICRSPMAEGIFREIAAARDLSVTVDSAGTGGWHVGEPPDRRGQAKLRSEGIDISKQRARQFHVSDFAEFDLILAMDKQNYGNLQNMTGDKEAGKVKLFVSFASQAAVEEIPDPYYGGDDGFDHVYELITDASNGLADFIQAKG